MGLLSSRLIFSVVCSQINSELKKYQPEHELIAMFSKACLLFRHVYAIQSWQTQGYNRNHLSRTAQG